GISHCEKGTVQTRNCPFSSISHIRKSHPQYHCGSGFPQSTLLNISCCLLHIPSAGNKDLFEFFNGILVCHTGDVIAHHPLQRLPSFDQVTVFLGHGHGIFPVIKV